MIPDVDTTTLAEVDSIWQKFEARLPEALQVLADRGMQHLDARVYLRTLVPFAASMLVRGPDFNNRVTKRMSAGFGSENLGHPFPSMNDIAQGSRVIELQRLLAVFCSANWAVMHTPPGVELMTSDVGYSLASEFTQENHPDSYLIPLSRHEVAIVTPRRDGLVCFFDKELGWRSPVTHRTLTEQLVDTLNRSMAIYSRQFTVGPTREVVEKYSSLNAGSMPLYAYEFPLHDFPSTRCLRNHDLEWFRLVSVLAKTPESEGLDEFDIDFEYISSDWFPPPYFAMNRRIEISGLEKRGKSIWLHLHELDPETSDSLYD